VRILDSVVIMLEGGDKSDLKILDEEPKESEEKAGQKAS